MTGPEEDPEAGDGTGGLSDEEYADLVDEQAGAADAGHDPTAGGTASGGVHIGTPADPGAVEAVKVIDQAARAAFGAPQPEGVDVDVDTAQGRAELAGRLVTPAYQKLMRGTINPVLGAVLGLGFIVALAALEGDALAPPDDEDDDEEEPERSSAISPDAKTPGSTSGGTADRAPPPRPDGETFVEDGVEAVDHGLQD